MMSFKRISIFLIFVFFSLFQSVMFCLSIERFRPLTFEDEGFYMEMPGNWEPEIGEWAESNAPDTLYSKDIRFTGAGDADIRLQIFQLGHKWTSFGYARGIVAFYKSTSHSSSNKNYDLGMEVMNISYIYISGFKAAKCEVLQKGPVVKRRLEYVFTNNAYAGYYLTFSAAEGKFAELKETFERVANSLVYERAPLFPEEPPRNLKEKTKMSGKKFAFILAPLTTLAFIFIIFSLFTRGEYLSAKLENTLINIAIAIILAAALIFFNHVTRNPIFVRVIPVVLVGQLLSVIAIINYRKIKSKYKAKYGKASSDDAWICRQCGIENHVITLVCLECGESRDEGKP